MSLTVLTRSQAAFSWNPLSGACEVGHLMRPFRLLVTNGSQADDTEVTVREDILKKLSGNKQSGMYAFSLSQSLFAF